MNRLSVYALAIAAGLAPLCSPLAASAAEPAGIVTILEGSAAVLRGAGRVVAAEGVHLEAQDIIHTAEASFAQLELADASVAQLGPNTRLLVSVNPPGQKPERALYVLSGWVKYITTARAATPVAAFELRGPLFELEPAAGVVVLKASTTEITLFAEAGTMRLAERWGGARSGDITLTAGQIYKRKAASKHEISAALPAEFLSDMPRAYRDSLPARRERFAKRDTAPQPGPDFTYAEVEDWLKAEPALRRGFVQRWRGKAREPAFRTALLSNFAAHPEWDPVLFPEKYLPKQPFRTMAFR